MDQCLKDCCLMNSQPTLLFLTYFWFSELWPYYQGDVNQTALYSMAFWNLVLQIFVAFISINLESNSSDILALDSIYSGNFFVTGYFPLIWEGSIAHFHGLADYVKEGLPFAWDSWIFYRFLLMFPTDFTTLNILLLFHLSIIYFVFMHSFWFYFI